MATLRLLGLLCAALFAGEVSPAGVRIPVVPALYAPPAIEWTNPLPHTTAIPLEAALSRLSTLGVQVPSLRADLPAADRLQALAPVVAQLGQLGMDPAAFAAHNAHEQDLALEMALSAAKEDVTQKAYDLVSRAKTLVWNETSYDKQKREELYAVAAQLGELKAHYMDLVPPEERDFVAQGELQARARFHEVQKALVDGTTIPSADALMGKASPKAEPGAAVSGKGSRPRSSGTGTAVALLERMKSTKSGWGQKDLDAVYRGYGFVMEEGGNHRKYYHPRYPQLWTMVARHNDLPPGYAQTAIKLVAELERLEGPALPASAVTGEAAIPPLPKPTRESSAQKPQVIAQADAPIEAAAPAPAPAPEPKPKTKSPPKAQPKIETVATTLAPAEPREAAPKAETPAPAAEAPKNLPVERGFLQKLKRLLGLKD